MRTVLVAVDVAEQANPVIAALQTLHFQPTTTVVLAHVMRPQDSDSPVDRPEDSRKDVLQVEDFLQALSTDIAAMLENRLMHPLILEIASGDPAEEIIRLAGIYSAELIVLGSRGLKGVNRVILGSVSAQVVEVANCSVYVVKGD